AANLPTTALLAAGADDVSTAVASLFADYGQEFQALGVQASAFHRQFVQVLTSGAGSYLATELASAAPLASVQQELLSVINAPTEALLGRALIGNGGGGGAGGTGANGGAGGAGGWLLGNGGHGGAAGTGAQGGVGGSAGLLGKGGTGGNASGNFGGAGGHGGWLGGSNGTAGTGAPASATIPLEVYNVTEPVINLSVNGGPTTTALVDTGSNGLVIPLREIGWQHLGLPTHLGTGAYSGGLIYA